MKSQKEINLDERILSLLRPEKLGGVDLPYNAAKCLIADPEVTAMQDYANTVSIIRLGFNDHGPVHMRTVTKNCIKMIKLLHEAGVKTSLEQEEIGTFTDSVTAVIFASFLHDLGMSIGRQDHEMYSVHLAMPIINRILDEILPDQIQKKAIIRSMAMEGIAGHMGAHRIHSLEAGLILVGDGCDMTKGRARIPMALSTEAKVGDIHKYSANSIERVHISDVPANDDDRKPIRIEVIMSSEVGFFQIEEVLIPKINSSPAKPYISLHAGVANEPLKRYL